MTRFLFSILLLSAVFSGYISVEEDNNEAFLKRIATSSYSSLPDTIHTGYQVFEPVLPELQQTTVPLKLPSYLASEKHSIGDFHAIIDKITDDEYVIQIAAVPDCNWNTFCLIGEASGKTDNNFLPPEESTNIQLNEGIIGYFTESVCTISCSLSVITWHQNGYTYRVGKKSSQDVLIDIANSAIDSSIGN